MKTVDTLDICAPPVSASLLSLFEGVHFSCLAGKRGAFAGMCLPAGGTGELRLPEFKEAADGDLALGWRVQHVLFG